MENRRFKWLRIYQVSCVFFLSTLVTSCAARFDPSAFRDIEAQSNTEQVYVAPARQAPVSYFRDRDCGDFNRWQQAQDFYIASGPGDPHDLDRDNDGIACESLR